jgi:hypothetical protein
MGLFREFNTGLLCVYQYLPIYRDDGWPSLFVEDIAKRGLIFKVQENGLFLGKDIMIL